MDTRVFIFQMVMVSIYCVSIRIINCKKPRPSNWDIQKTVFWMPLAADESIHLIIYFSLWRIERFFLIFCSLLSDNRMTRRMWSWNICRMKQGSWRPTVSYQITRGWTRVLQVGSTRKMMGLVTTTLSLRMRTLTNSRLLLLVRAHFLHISRLLYSWGKYKIEWWSNVLSNMVKLYLVYVYVMGELQFLYTLLLSI